VILGWDESSSISSGLSDGSDNLSSEEFNTSPALNSLPTTPIGSRRNSAIVLRTDAEKRSLLVESGLSWDNDDPKHGHKSLGGGGLYETGSLKTESTHKWKKARPPAEGPEVARTLGQSNMLKRPGRNPPVGVTSPIAHTPPSGLKPADAGKDHKNHPPSNGEQRKPPSGLVRPSTGGNFGFKKPATAASASNNNGPHHPSGNSGSGSGGGTAVGSLAAPKTPKTSGIPVKPVTGSSRKTSLDVLSGDQSGFLSPNARGSLQYRSLPRPAKTSTLTLTRPSSARPIGTPAADVGSGPVKQPPSVAPQSSRLKEPASGIGSGGTGLVKPGGRGIPSPGPVNQTDREKEKERAKAKAVVSDTECGGGGSLKGSPAQTPLENGGKLQGLRPPSGKTSADLPSPNTHRLSGARSLVTPLSMDKRSCGVLEAVIQDQLPPKIPPYSKLQDLVSSAGSLSGPCLTPSPAPLLNVNSSDCFSSSAIGLGPRQLSSLGVAGNAASGATSPLVYPRISGLHRSMESLSLQMSLAPEPHKREKDRDHATRGYPAMEPLVRDRKEETPPPATWSSGSTKGLSFHRAPPSEEEGKERRHSHVVMSMTDSLTPPRLGGGGAPPRMTRSNSIPAQDASLELYGPSPLGSTLSLSERPRSMGMVRSGSFRDRESNDEVHGSVLSLASNASSSYSSAEERIQGEQIRKLRRELESSQEKVANLTTQLTANANLVAAFEQSLSLMTTRLQSLSNSCESISSLNSLSSLSSLGSLKDQELRSSFGKAFSIKKGGKTYSDIEEMATPDSSAPNSPKMGHEGSEAGDASPSMRTSISATSSPSGLASLLGPTSRQSMSMSLTKSFSLSLNDCKDPVSSVDLTSVSSNRDETTVQVLVHISDQVEDSKQQDYSLGSLTVDKRTDWTCLDSLIAKIFRDYLMQVDPTASLGLSCDSLHSYQLTEDGQRVIGGDKPALSPSRCLGNSPARILVTLKGLREKCVDALVFETLIPKPMMQHYISLLMKHRRLVMSGPSGTGKTYLAQRLAQYALQRSRPESPDGGPKSSPPGGHSHAVSFNMHRQSNKELQLYLSDLANQIDRESGGEMPLAIIIDDISDTTAISELINGALTCKYHKCPYIIGTTNQPVKMTSNNGLHQSFRMVTFSNNVEPANGFLVRYLHRKAAEAKQKEKVHDPVGHQALLGVLDWVPQLWYHLHAFLEKHSTSDFLIGPCFFLSCPVTVAEFRPWFIDLWNQSIIPYLQEGARDGGKVHGQKVVWEDPVDWVRGTLPWPNAQQDQSRLFHLPPPTVGPSTEEKKPPKDTPPPSTLESDPLMAMLLKLQESANYIESPERDCTMDPSFQTTL
ncbi:hypothetical protein NHX12_012637, partial [Muraenolepis orangiensis]